jgi:NADH-quinone oxidoreductase subunit H
VNGTILAIAAARAAAVLLMILVAVFVLTWMERKGAAYIQDRRGPNRASIAGIRLGGLLHILADAIKLFTKEASAPAASARALMLAAPAIAFVAAAGAAAVVPFTGTIEIEGHRLALQVADLRAGLVYAFAFAALGTYGLLLAGWASSGTYSLFGALRAAAQFISYELALGMTAVALFLVAGTFDLSAIVADQGETLWRWNILRQPLAFVLFFTALLAEGCRLPFDLPEGDSEIVAGYHVEYSGMRFGMFYLAEYAHIFVSSAIAALIFFGGWQIPFVAEAALRAHAPEIVGLSWPIAGLALILAGGFLARRFRRRFRDARDFEPLVFGLPMMAAGVALLWLYFPNVDAVLESAWLPDAVQLLLGFAAMLAKTLALCGAFIWVRWSLPRFRYDQLMKLGWKILLPLAMLNLLATAVVMLYI